MTAEENPYLPALRRDLSFFAGPPGADGGPTYTLYDPISGNYARLGWAEGVVLQHLMPGMRLQDMMQQLQEETTLRVDTAYVLAVCQQAEAANLTNRLGHVAGAGYAQTAARQHTSAGRWLLQHYLYIQVPLIHPERFLQATLPWARVLVSRAAKLMYALIWLLALVLLSERFGDYVGRFEHFLTPWGALCSAVALSSIKAIHEFAHAYTACHFGVRVRKMGIALMIFWPVPFSDVTDAWQLPLRRGRFLIGAAGIAAETVMAGVALLLWCLLPDGPLRSACFLLSSVTLLSTFLANLNPAMRFDGYYLLSDAWGIENLRDRAGDVWRWWMHRVFLASDMPDPEPALSRREHFALVVYAVYGYGYRILLYAGIATLVYVKFTKTIGIFLFVLEIWSFIVTPLIREATRVIRLREHFRLNWRLLLAVLVVGACVLWLALPMPRRLVLSGVLCPAARQVVYAPVGGEIEQIDMPQGRHVRKGDQLVHIALPQIDAEAALLARELAVLQIMIQHYAGEDGALANLVRAEDEYEKVRAQLDQIEEERRHNTVMADMDGVLVGTDRAAKPKLWLEAGTLLGEVISPTRSVVAYLPEANLQDVPVGSYVEFAYADTEYRRGRVAARAPALMLPTEHFALAATSGGGLPVVSANQGGMRLSGSYYQIYITIDAGPPLPVWQPVVVRTQTAPRSLLLDGARYLWHLLLLESGL